MTEQAVSIRTLAIEIDINATPSNVWEALTADIGKWWPAEFYTGGAVGTRNMEIELAPGGRMFESWSAGGGTLWGTVVSFEPDKFLQVLGHQFPNWGGPLEWYGTWSLETVGQRTNLSYSEASMGNISEKGLTQKDLGWRFLLACLKAFIDDQPAPVWEDQ